MAKKILSESAKWRGFLGMAMALILVQACSPGDTREFLGPNPGTTLVRLSVVPRSARLVLGDSVGLIAYGHFRNGDSAAVPASWSSRTGAISDAGWYRAVQEGADTIRAVSKAQPSLADAAMVEVMNPLDLAIVRVTPQVETLPIGRTIQFAARATLPDRSEITPKVTWSTTGGEISPTGLFSAIGQPGTYQVTAQIKGRTPSGAASVTVLPAALDVLLLNPSSVALLASETQQFTVAAAWSDGSTTPPPLTWSATGGTVSSTGLYTAGQAAGTFSVIAATAAGDRADTSTVTVSVPPPTLTRVILAPAAVTLAPGTTRQFTVTGSWSDGSATVPAVNYSATGGTITAGGLYTAGTLAGSFQVIVTQQGGTKADTSLVTVALPGAGLLQLVLDPSSLTLTPGQTGQFSVAGAWSDGSTTAPAVTYSATGGAITPGGLYTAGATPGTYRVIATQEGGTKADTSAVTVTTPPLTALVLVTQPAGAVSGVPLSQQPVIELRNVQNQPVPQSGIVVSASKASGPGILGGTITSTTNSEGRATFAGLEITGTGDYTLDFTSSGLAKVTSQNVAVVLPSLRLLAAARGLTLGAGGLDNPPLRTDPSYRSMLAAQYNGVTFGGVLQFFRVHPAQAQYNFADADEALAFAEANNMVFQGHVLVYDQGLPAWITGSTFTKAQLLAVLKDHITTVVGHYRGRIATWDVVNEVMGNYSSSLRNTVWLSTIGPEYIDSAFVWAHRADPVAKLYLNDYDAEAVNSKADSILQLVRGLRARGIPIDGVGFQAHFSVSPPALSSIRANFARFASAGFDIRVSEMDVRVADGAGSAALETQGATYRDVLDACLMVTRCTGLTTWGFTDRYSWIPEFFPGFGRALPFDTAYQAKPAFDSLIVRLRRP